MSSDADQRAIASADRAANRARAIPPRRLNRLSQLFNLAMLATGAGALAWILWAIGWHRIANMIDGIGTWFLVVFALDVVALCMDAAGLHAFMRPEARMVSYVRVLGTQASGRAINVLTFGGALGEVTKLTMLDAFAPRARVVSSLVLLNLTQVFLSVLGIMLGTPVMFLLVELPRGILLTVLIGVALVVPPVVALAVLVRRGAASTIVAVLRSTRAISSERAVAWTHRLTDVDAHIRELVASRSPGTWRGIGWLVTSKLVTTCSSLVLLRAAEVDLSLALFVTSMSLGVLIQWVSQIVPMGLGLADGGNYALYDLVGASGAHGVIVTMANRARSLAVAILGLGAMAIMSILQRIARARIRVLREAMARVASVARRIRRASGSRGGNPGP